MDQYSGPRVTTADSAPSPGGYSRSIQCRSYIEIVLDNGYLNKTPHYGVLYAKLEQ